MMTGSADYMVAIGERTERVTLYGALKKGQVLSDREKEIRDVVSDGFRGERYAGKAGNTIDPYVAAEQILSDHYGYARMVKADYRWVPGMRY